MSQYSEEELRKQIREELAAEAARAKERRQIASTPPRDEAETMRRRILEEERRRFFQDSAEHFEYINENGDVEWLTREEITAREGYFDYEEHVEDPLAGRRRFLIWMSVGVFVMLSAAWGVVSWVLPATGQLSVVCNVPAATILVDGQESGYTTDAILELPIGEHLVEVRAWGYHVSGDPVRVVTVQEDQLSLSEFRLEAVGQATEP